MCGGMSLWISGQAREFSRAEEAVEDQEDQSVGVVGSRGWNQSLAEGHETSQLVSSCLYLFASLCSCQSVLTSLIPPSLPPISLKRIPTQAAVVPAQHHRAAPATTPATSRASSAAACPSARRSALQL